MGNETWITGREAGRRLGVDVKTLPRVVAAGGVRTKELPGVPKRFNADDIDRIAAGAIRQNGHQPALAARG